MSGAQRQAKTLPLPSREGVGGRGRRLVRGPLPPTPSREGRGSFRLRELLSPLPVGRVLARLVLALIILAVGIPAKRQPALLDERPGRDRGAAVDLAARRIAVGECRRHAARHGAGLCDRHRCRHRARPAVRPDAAAAIACCRPTSRRCTRCRRSRWRRCSSSCSASASSRRWRWSPSPCSSWC